ncbi:ATP-binding protein [Brevundimonas sp. SORGH_AS_0993]|uniref:sensor histidine kinase n=1 Tax=Brevundimonas sp. SORGH_AS_0993 TaxID=3041794 RepID=UPI002783629A|nr:ATP-binding protein [Brevundimonas sp. SORGH_AS_0993]MDQ1153101.1 two-component system C4-dicarboxylate transport sensor histidine kinase DctB [Brevundimonas sp. SORGH_AS_0993]
MWGALVLCWLLAVLIAALVAGEVARRDASAVLARQAETAAALHAAVLRSELEKHRSLPLALATDPDIAELLKRAPHGSAQAINLKLEALAAQTRAAAIYVIDAGGVTRAASNWRLSTSFVGADYGFRPYFIGAMRNGAAEFFALGTVSGRPGLYLARRIDDAAGGPGGVVVVKVEFDTLEAEWRASGEPAYVADPAGVVLITSVPDWRFRTLRPLDAASRRLTLTDQTLGHGALTPLPFATPDSERPRLIKASVDGVRRDWMYSRADTATPGWVLHLLTPTRGAIGAAVASARALTALILTLIFGVAGVLLRRRQQAAARERAAQAARVELERRIAERTQDLSAANAALNRQIEERQAAEAAREVLRDELVQAGKLAALGQIAAGVAHEINQPVAAIRTQAETVAAYLERGQPAKAARPLQKIGEMTARIGAITQELRAFSRKAEAAQQSVNLHQAVDGALLLLGGRLKQAGVRLVRDKPTVEATVLGERFRLEQVLVNLMQNALEALEGTAGPVITLSITPRGTEIDLIVADNGPGVSDEVRNQLFTPFVTSKATGLGLGLVICRDIVAGFGGELTLRPSPRGAVFVVTLRVA